MNGRQKEILQAQLNNEKQVLKELQQVFKQAIKDCSVNISQLSTRTDMENIQAIIYQQQYQNGWLYQRWAQRHPELSSLAQATVGICTISITLLRRYQNGYVGVIYDIADSDSLIVSNSRTVLKGIAERVLFKSPDSERKKLGRSAKKVSRGVSNGSALNDRRR